MSVSYLITLFNKEDFIEAVIKAACNECATTGGEVIIYDDLSTDASLVKLEQFIATRPNQHVPVKIIKGKINQGVGHATNCLIELANEAFTRVIDADDVIVEGSTTAMLKLMQRNGLGFMYGLTTEVGNNDAGLAAQDFSRWTPIPNPTHLILTHTIAGTSPSLFRTAELKKVVPVPEWIKRTQDFLITLRVANSGVAIGRIEAVVSVGPSNRTGNNLSASLAAMFGEMSRDVAYDGEKLPLDELRFVSRRYAGRASKYFRRRGKAKLTLTEKLRLGLWRATAVVASRSTCITRLNAVADFLDRDKDVLVTGPAR